MTAAQADDALMGLAHDVLADIVACQQILALSEVREFERTVNGRTEVVRPFERLQGEAVHEHIGLPGELDQDTAHDLAAYKGFDYKNINSYLRAPDYKTAVANNYGQFPSEKEMQSSVGHLDGAFHKAVPTAKPVVVYRGAGGFLPERTPPGTILHDNAYVSTTTDKDTAGYFAAGATRANPKYAQIIRITVPAGESMLSYAKMIDSKVLPSYMTSAGDTGEHGDEEREVLLPRNRSMRVTGTHGRFLDVELLPEDKPAAQAAPAAPALTPAQAALQKAMAYKKAQVAATQVALSRSPDRSDRYVWKPGDLRITRPPVPIS